MSTYDWLICDTSGEAVEVVAMVGNFTTPRIDPNVLGAFLLYHRCAYPKAIMRISSIENESLFESEEAKSMYGIKEVGLIAWTRDNYRMLVDRNEVSAAGMSRLDEGGKFIWSNP